MNRAGGGSDSVTYGGQRIFFDILYVNRKTLEIAVHPDRRVVVKAPTGTERDKIQDKMIKRARWIKRQLDYFNQFEPRTPARRYVGGETHLYMGKQYRLKIEAGDEEEVKLIRGFFRVYVKGDPSPGRVKRLMADWYKEKAGKRLRAIFDDRLAAFRRMGLAAPTLSVRRMKTRWGSLSPNLTLTLNVDLIRAPKECIEYVVAHELCHLKHRHHDADFFRLLERQMPDWERRKRKLEMAMA